MDKWINKVCSIHTIEYYSALKNKEILTYAITQINLEYIVLSEISQSEKYNFIYVKYLRVVKYMETESKMVVASIAGGMGVFCKMESIKELMVTVAQQCECP